MIEIFKKDDEKCITKIKKIKNFLFCGYEDGRVDIFSLNKEKGDFYIYSRIEIEKNSISINNNFKISNIFYNNEKGLVYIFWEKGKKVSIYEINYNKHIKEIELTDNAILFSYINLKMNRILVIDSYGTFWIYELIQEDNSVKLLQASYNKLSDISSVEIFNEKNNDQTINIFIGKNDKVLLYQYSNENNNFILKLACDIKFRINSIIYLKRHKCLLIGCNNGTIQIWKDTSKMPEYILDSGYDKINKIFFDENNKYLFICDDKNIKILEINLENILIKEENNEDNKNIIDISETLKDEGDKLVENNILLINQAFQTPLCSDKRDIINNNEENMKEGEINEQNKINKEDMIENKETEIHSDLEENKYEYEVRSIGSLDGWDEW